MKNVSSFISNQKGLSIMEIMVLIVSLGIAASAVVNSLQSGSVQQDITNKKEDIAVIGQSLSSSVSSVFLDTLNTTSNKKTQGICSLLRAETSESSIASIYMYLSKYEDNIFTEQRWLKYLKSLKVAASESKCNAFLKGDGYQRCYEIDYNNLADLGVTLTELKALDPVIGVNVKAIYTNPLEDVPFSILTPDDEKKYDAKSIGFRYEIFTEYNRKKAKNNAPASRNVKSYSGLVWTGSVGTCDYGDKVLAVSSDGFGNSNNSIVFNNGGFDQASVSRSQDPPLDVTKVLTQVQRGKLVDDQSNPVFLTSDDTSLVFSSCNEVKFTCPQKESLDSEREYAALEMELKANYRTPNIISDSANEMSISPNFDFKHEVTGDSLWSENNNYYVTYNVAGRHYKRIEFVSEKTNQEMSDSEFADGRFYRAIFAKVPKIKLARTELKFSGEKTIKLMVSDAFKNEKNGNKACRQICTAGNGYNSTDQMRYNAEFSYKVNFTNIDEDTPTDFKPISSPVSCTACYMKSCDRYGLKTFGAMTQMPTEPLDAGVPECIVHEDNVVDSFLEAPAMGASNSGKCVALKMKNGDNAGFDYYAEDCSSEKRVLCFNYGRHYLAQLPSAGGFEKKKVAYSNASELCFKTSHESIDWDGLESLFIQQGFIGESDGNGGNTTPINPNPLATEFLGQSTSGNSISIYNLSRQGSFFAPIGLNQEKRMREFAELPNYGEKSELQSSSFWVGLKTDNLGYVYSPAPQIHASASDQWALHWNGSNNLVPKKITTAIQVKSGDASVLMNHIKYRGIASAKVEKPMNEDSDNGNAIVKLRFLCRRDAYPHRVFITDARSEKFSDGHTKCKNEGGVFLPPTTTGGWEEAYQLVAPSAVKAAFPDYDVSADFKHDPAWVALGSDGKIKLLDDYKDILSEDATDFVDKDGVFITNGNDNSADHLCFIASTGEFAVKDSACSGSFDYYPGNIKDVMSSDNYVLKVSLIGAINSSNKKLRVKKEEESSTNNS